MDKIIGIGNALVDILAVIEDDALLESMNLPKGSMQLIGKDTLLKIQDLFSRMKTHCATGGSAGNTISALAHLGAAPGFIGKIGTDEYGMFFRKHLQQMKVETRLLECALPSGIASTFISPDGERTFGTYLGAASTLQAEELMPEMFAGYSYLYVEGYLLQNHELIERAMRLAKEAGLQVCLDMASYNIVEAGRDFFDHLITQYVDVVFANESEARAYTGKEPHEALEEIASQCSIAIVKIGKEGSLIRKGTQCLQVAPVIVTNVVDTTGAGDFYAAGFLYGLTNGYSLEKCARIATILSSHVIQVVGTELSETKWDEIKLNIDTVLQA